MKYKIEHLVLCEVSTVRYVEADSMEEALGKTAGIQTVTDGSECNYEIISDVKTLAVSITEV